MRDSRLFLTVLIIALALISTVTLIAQIPAPYDEYLALSTLGPLGTADEYFPANNVNIHLGVQNQWFVEVYNHFPNLQLLRVELKLLNATMPGPNQLNDQPSERPPFYEVTRMVTSNETWKIPILWSVSNASEINGTVTVNSLTLNGEELTPNVVISADNGYNFRIVIELWVFNGDSDAFNFAWASNGSPRVAWNEIWFNMTLGNS